MIIGQPGSGKSTLARRLGEKLNLPVVHVDLIHWQPGWVERAGAEKDALCALEHAKSEWIFEGGRSSTWPERLDRADTLIFLDFPLWIRGYRILKRRVEYHGTTRPDLPADCPERLDGDFLRFVWNTRNAGRQKMIQLFNAAPSNKEKYRLRNGTEVDDFLTCM